MMRTSTERGRAWFAAALVAWLTGGCAQKQGEYVSFRRVNKPASPPAVKHCCDATGHQQGSQPFILGGACCCTPTTS